jgi:density-regulated protein DRP1
MSNDNTDKEIEVNTEKLENLDIESEDKVIKPKIVKYCEACRFPEEYCEYSHKAKDIAKGIKKLETKENEEKKSAEETNGEEGKEKKPKKEKKKIVEIKVTRRGKKKNVTHVFNLDEFSLNIKDVAKLFSKKFACSSTVTKEANKDCIVLTGEFTYEIVDFLREKFPTVISEDSCKITEGK